MGGGRRVIVSYSQVQCFKQCKFKYYLRYIEKLTVNKELTADNPLLLGSMVHKIIEDGGNPSTAVGEYRRNWLCTSNEVEREIFKATEALKTLPVEFYDGKHEKRVRTNKLLGYIDHISSDGTISDFKYTARFNPNYHDGLQLSLYAEALDSKDSKLQYVIVPKCLLRLKQYEDEEELRLRIKSWYDSHPVEVHEVPYQTEGVNEFWKTVEQLENFNGDWDEKSPSRLCDWCDYNKICLK